MNPASIRRFALITSAVVVTSGASCSELGPDETGTVERQPATKPSQTIAAGEQKMNTDEQVAIARKDLAERMGIEIDAIEIESVRQVHWRSGAAGCPEPGMNYTMAISPGLQIILSVGGELQRYHAGRNRPAFYCPADRAEAPALGPGEEAM